MVRRTALSFALASSLVACLAACPAACKEAPASPTSAAEHTTESAESAAQTEAFAHPPMTPPPGAAPTGSSAADPAAATPPARPPFDASNPVVAGMKWTTPSGFTYRAPASEMRLAEYVVGRVGETDVALSVFHFPGMGGTIDANLTRWIGQFSQTDGSSTLAATRAGTTTVDGIRVTTIETHGHFEGGAMGGGNGDDYRLLGAIAEAPDGPVFFKLVGPRSVVDAAEPAFRALVASFTRVTR